MIAAARGARFTIQQLATDLSVAHASISCKLERMKNDSAYCVRGALFSRYLPDFCCAIRCNESGVRYALVKDLNHARCKCYCCRPP